MRKFENHVYMDICESSYGIFEKTRYSTYLNFCRIIKIKLENNDIDKVVESQVLFIAKVIGKLFAFDRQMSVDYIYKFFIQEKYLIFESPVRQMKSCLPINDDINKLI